MTDCSSYGTDYNSVSLKQKIVCAKKSHICAECRSIIHEKTKYEYCVGVSDGNFFTNKTCLDCVSLRDAFFPSDGYVFDYVRDYVSEQINSLRGEISSECILPLTPKARNFVFDKIERAWNMEKTNVTE